MSSFTESVIEDAALAWLEAAGWAVLHGPDIAPASPGAERDNYGQMLLAARLRAALARLNPQIPADALEDVVSHTQGSGKSLTMAFYAGRVIREPGMSNPTLVVLTDRNDLDDQLFGTFSRCADLLR
jgi:type I site-specific restriction-modification system R (restriction) subunit